MFKKADLQKLLGSKLKVVKIDSKNKVTYRFTNKDLNKTYGARTYSSTKNQSINSVAKEIKNITSRM